MKRFLSLLFLLMPLLAQTEPLKLPIQAPSVLLINCDTQKVLFEKNAHAPSFPASTIKIATLLFALEEKNLQLDAKVTISQKAVGTIHASVKQADFDRYPSYLLEHDATIMGLKRGEVVTVRDLIYGMMLPSGDDAANALAEHCSGSIEKFIEELGLYLKRIGIHSTCVKNPHGLHHPQMTTTAHDLAQMTIRALKHPLFREVVGSSQFERSSGVILPQFNKLLRKGAHFYPRAIGVKTGYEGRARFNLVGAAQHEGRTLVSVILGCEKEQRYKETIALFDAAFKEKKVTRPLFAKEGELFTLKIPRGGAVLKAQLWEDLNVSYFPAEEPALKAKLQWKKLQAPIAEGQLVGCIKILDEKERIIAAAPLHAISKVKVAFFFQLLSLCKILGLPLFLVFLLVFKPVRERLKLLKTKLLGA